MDEQKYANLFLNMGLQTGIYVVAKLIADGKVIEPKTAHAMQLIAGENIEKLSGMPAEDFAGQMAGAVKILMDAVDTANKGGV